ncbi:MAG: hypothetical protein P4L33_11405 [Capsulimonadaceae bacterium]|nr:hypothetical protein [Capsulimonadaceae bacterium]
MSIPKTASSVLHDHITLEVEGIDRMYLNVFVPRLQREVGVVSFFRDHRGMQFASSALMDPITKEFVKAIDKFATRNDIPVIAFLKGQRKDDIAKEHLAKFGQDQGVLFIGKAQEKTAVFRTERRKVPGKDISYPWIVRSTAMVNHYYFYCADRDFGPFFIKYCSYFPYNAKLCINGHEYAKRQLALEGIEFEPLDNGIASCDNPARLQQICDDFSADTIRALWLKWQAILPQPLTDSDRQVGYDYDLSILQAEFSLTQVLDKPVSGRIFFEDVIRENLAIGRPDQVQLIFDRRVTKRTPGRFRTRVITEGVVPSLHLDYKHTRIKQYHKEGQALRTETTINDTHDFGIGKRLIDKNLGALRQVGFNANRQLLNVQKIGHDPAVGEDVICSMQKSVIVNGVRASALALADERAQFLLQALVVFRLLPNGFSNKDLREHLAPLMGKAVEELTQGQMTYHLRRLKLRNLIERIPKSHRYRVTDHGLTVALFYTCAYSKLFRPVAAEVFTHDTPIRIAFQTAQNAIDHYSRQRKVAV